MSSKLMAPVPVLNTEITVFQTNILLQASKPVKSFDAAQKPDVESTSGGACCILLCSSFKCSEPLFFELSCIVAIDKPQL